MADFTGFYLDNIHSSTYGILRVSDGDRYKEGLIPEFENKEIELSGGRGSAYVSTKYKKTPFEVSIAFDHLTEQQFRDLRKWLGAEQLRAFRFDERPYKTYWVKLESRPELEYVCFMEQADNGFIGDKERIYKGEGKLKFIVFDPFGYCVDSSTKMTEEGLIETDGINWQVLDSYTPFEIVDDNVSEWAATSGLKREEEMKNYNKFESRKELVLLGDFNKDGVIDQWDIDYGNNVYENLDKSSKRDLFLADFNQNGSVDKSDNFYLNEYAWYPQPELIYAEWQGSSVLRTKLYNPGDFNTDFELQISLEEISDGEEITLLLYDEKEEKLLNGFKFTTKGLSKTDKILLNSKQHSLTVFSGDKKSLRYDLIKSSHWFQIPIGESCLKIESGGSLIKSAEIKYSYKYY